MAARTTAEAVRAIIETSEEIDVEAFIDTATALTDYVASKDTSNQLTATLLERIETYLAAHYYSLRDPLYVGKKTGDAQGSFPERSYWAVAQGLDVTGTLLAIAAGNPTVGIYHLGTPYSQRPNWWEVA